MGLNYTPAATSFLRDARNSATSDERWQQQRATVALTGRTTNRHLVVFRNSPKLLLRKKCWGELHVASALRAESDYYVMLRVSDGIWAAAERKFRINFGLNFVCSYYPHIFLLFTDGCKQTRSEKESDQSLELSAGCGSFIVSARMVLFFWDMPTLGTMATMNTMKKLNPVETVET